MAKGKRARDKAATVFNHKGEVMSKFPKTLAVAFDGSGESQYMLAMKNPGEHVPQHGEERVGIYQLLRVVTVKNESRIVDERKAVKRA